MTPPPVAKRIDFQEVRPGEVVIVGINMNVDQMIAFAFRGLFALAIAAAGIGLAVSIPMLIVAALSS